jgi:pyruvate dehydrogenase E1 component alpha subunit
MPRGEIHPAHTVESLSVLDEDGHLDRDLEPDIDDDLLRRMHRCMLLCRRFDERMLNLQRQGRIGTFGPVQGQEAAQVGAAACLTPRDWFVPSYRETCFSLWRGTPMSGLLLYTAGYNEGGRIPDGQNDLPISIPVGTQMLHAVGIAYAMTLRREADAVLTCFGDGATSQGDFHEAMNFAAVFRSPVVFFCQNNQWAISVPRHKQTHARTIAQKALGYGMRGVQVDGNDILAVYAATQDALRRARDERDPTLIECVTYRMSVHTTADDPTKYRTEDEVALWRKRDPIRRFQTYLIDKGLLSEDAIGDLEKEVQGEIEAAWAETRRLMEQYTDPLHMFAHVYGELPPYLAEQRREAEQALAAAGGGKGGG